MHQQKKEKPRTFLGSLKYLILLNFMKPRWPPGPGPPGKPPPWSSAGSSRPFPKRVCVWKWKKTRQHICSVHAGGGGGGTHSTSANFTSRVMRVAGGKSTSAEEEENVSEEMLALGCKTKTWNCEEDKKKNPPSTMVMGVFLLDYLCERAGAARWGCHEEPDPSKFSAGGFLA